MTTPVTYVIMAGGQGERLWPLVRRGVPKVCVSNGSRSVLGETLSRLRGLSPRQRVLIVTAASQKQPVRAVLPRACHRWIVTEPQPRNTAACIALAASIVAARDPGGILVALPADHWVSPIDGFRRTLRAAIEVARQDPRMVTIGLRPTRIHSGLGHLCTAGPADLRYGCRTRRLVRFIEKPSAARAAQLMKQQGTYWNAGVFVAQVATFLRLIARYLPNHATRIGPLGRLVDRAVFARRAARVYRNLPAVSFDDGVMAHVRDGHVVEAAYRWEDLGSWDSWVRTSRAHAPTVMVDSRRTHVVSAEGRNTHLVAVVGVDDVIVVHTPDATLVCRAAKAQLVRAVVAQLAQRKHLGRYR